MEDFIANLAIAKELYEIAEKIPNNFPPNVYFYNIIFFKVYCAYQVCISNKIIHMHTMSLSKVQHRFLNWNKCAIILTLMPMLI